MRNEQLLTVYFDMQKMAKTALVAAKEYTRNKNFKAPTTVLFANRKIPAYIFPAKKITNVDVESYLIDKIKLYTIQDLKNE
jgi:2'-5' RNA ligase